MTRLTDLIQGQSGQGALSSDTKHAARSVGLTSLPIPTSFSPSIAEVDWHQRAYQELQGIKCAVRARQPWTVEELVRIASGIVTSLGANDKLLETVLRHDAGDYLVNNAVNVSIVSVKIAEVLRWNCLLDGRTYAYPLTRRKTHHHSRSLVILYM